MAGAKTAGMAGDFAARLDAALEVLQLKAVTLEPWGIRSDTLSRWKKDGGTTAPSLRHLELALGLPRGAFEWDEEQWEILLKVLKTVSATQSGADPADTMLAGAVALLEQARRFRQRRDAVFLVDRLTDAAARMELKQPRGRASGPAEKPRKKRKA
jgi:hypothetical protein